MSSVYDACSAWCTPARLSLLCLKKKPLVWLSCFWAWLMVCKVYHNHVLIFVLIPPTCYDAMCLACYPIQIALCFGMLCTHVHVHSMCVCVQLLVLPTNIGFDIPALQ